MAHIPCPECGRLARIVDRFTLPSTDGALEHLKIRCPGGHALTPLVEDIWPGAIVPRIAEPRAAMQTARFSHQR